MGTPLAQLQGQDFRMTMDVDLSPEGLHLNLSVISDFDSLVGIHYYYALPNGKGRVHSDVRPTYRDGDEVKDLPTDWEIDAQNGLSYDLSHAADYGFYPYKNPCGAHIVLDTEAYRLHTEYSTTCQENTWQLYRPAGAEFVCVEPMTAQDPRKPLLSVSSISIDLRIEAPKA
jgi:galactose mutarotase-like enzyme